MSRPDPTAALDARVSRCPVGHWQFDGVCKACLIKPPLPVVESGQGTSGGRG